MSNMVVKAGKTPLLGNQVLARLPGSSHYSVGFVIGVPSGYNHDYTQVPIKLLIVNALDESLYFEEYTYGINEGQWIFSGDFGIR